MKNDYFFLKDIALMFNISWMMVGSVVAGFLIGKWLSEKTGWEWLILLFSVLGAGSGMWTVWKYYKKNIENE